ncbi:MAG: efflux RND transporter permease subunit [Elusimicrobia bacterium]|nr:efflux RND transporter permease subunit [Elusimicrobiota bacterium]
MEENKGNIARFFVRNRHLSWLALCACIIWGVVGYNGMPMRKDPEIPVRVAVAVIPWPGVPAEKVEQLVTRKVEEKAAENTALEKIVSISRKSVSVVYFYLDQSVDDTDRQFDDLKIKLDSITGLPSGAGPVQYIKDFGDTAALMLTVASPAADGSEVALRASELRRSMQAARAGHGGKRISVVLNLPLDYGPEGVQSLRRAMLSALAAGEIGRDFVPLEGTSFAGVDGAFDFPPEEARRRITQCLREAMRLSDMHPDAWPLAFVAELSSAEEVLSGVAGPKYSYRQLDEYTDLLAKRLHSLPEVARVTRAGVVPEKIYLEYSQERLAAHSITLPQVAQALSARNITLPGGVLEAQGRDIGIVPSGQFSAETEISSSLVSVSGSGSPVYVRDIFNVRRDYENPPGYLNYITARGKDGRWERMRAVTLAVQMKSGEKIERFGRAVDGELENSRRLLPEDIVLKKTSDQPRQVEEKVSLFMSSLAEAVVLIVLVSLVGFWEWRISLLMATSIPVSLAITFGLMYAFGLDLQQVSIASLILALGLLVDVPVVASDAIKREMENGAPLGEACWRGPTKLSKAIFFATLTNIVAYLPFLLLTGDIKRFLVTMPWVITFSLLASYFVAMTFIPLFSSFILKQEKPASSLKAEGGFYGFYYRIGKYAITHRWKVLVWSLLFLALGGAVFPTLKTQFFPKDLSYLSYVDVWLPEDASIFSTADSARAVEDVIRESCREAAKGKRDILSTLTTFVGGGGPRFWFSVSPEMRQPNYAQVIIQVADNRDTNRIVGLLQRNLSARVPGAHVDVRQLETGKNVGIPVAVRISGYDAKQLLEAAQKVKEAFRTVPSAERIRDDWGSASLRLNYEISPDKANLSGLTNLDFAASSAGGLNGYPLTTFYRDDKQIPVVARLRMDDRAALSKLSSLYVFPLRGGPKLPLAQAADIKYELGPERIMRRNQFRTVTVSCFPAPGVLPSEVLGKVRKQLDVIEHQLPPGYKMEIGGEYEEQVKGFRELAVVMLVSILCIYVALVVQFNNLVKPLIVFAAIPYGVSGALLMLKAMNMPFGFMAFLGVASLIGVIISHIIVLFDFIELMQEKGEPFESAVLDAGVVRLRPVLITVGAAVFGLIPLALHGGPLWEPLCYAQIGGLTFATFITLLLVPVIYAIFVLDLKLIRWDTPSENGR